MSIAMSASKKAIQDKLESQFKTAEAKLHTLKARAESAKADAEMAAIKELLPRKEALQKKLWELRELAADRWDRAKDDIEARIAEFEKLVKGIEAKTRSH
jgi:phage shock protein A